MYEYILELPPESFLQVGACRVARYSEGVIILPDAVCREAAANQRWYSVNYALCSFRAEGFLFWRIK